MGLQTISQAVEKKIIFLTPGRNRTPIHSNTAPCLATVLPDLSCLQELKSPHNVIIDVSRIYNENLLPIE
jgi:hypothetical protein